MARRDGLHSGKLLAQEDSFLCVEPAMFGSMPHQPGRRERAGHGPIAVRVEDAKKLQEVIHLRALPIATEEFASEAGAEFGIWKIRIGGEFAVGEPDGAQWQLAIRVHTVL